MTKPPANVLALPLEERAEMALKAAVEKVIVEHARQGLPMYIWRIPSPHAFPTLLTLRKSLPRSMPAAASHTP